MFAFNGNVCLSMLNMFVWVRPVLVLQILHNNNDDYNNNDDNKCMYVCMYVYIYIYIYIQIPMYTYVVMYYRY